MSSRLARLNAAPTLGAAFLIFATAACAQAPIVDASGRAASQQRPAAAPQADSGGQGELFYQLQLLRQEVMDLRGTVEQQGHELRQLKQQSLDRYLDLDKRLGSAGASASAAAPVASTGSAADIAQVPAQEGEYEAYRDAYKQVKDQQFDKAIPAFLSFLKRYPSGQYAPNAHYWLGELYLVSSPPALESARQHFSQLLEQYPGNSKQPDAMYKLGRVYFLTGDKARARQLLEQVVADYGNTGSSAAKLASQFLTQNF